MKYAILIIMMMAINANAGYPEKIKYWYSQNVSTNVPPLEEIIMMQDNSDGQGVHFKWHIENPPSKATIDAIDDATAIAWSTNEDDEKLSDYTVWSKREKAMFKLIVKEINKLRVKTGDPAYTVEQIKSALKEEME